MDATLQSITIYFGQSPQADWITVAGFIVGVIGGVFGAVSTYIAVAQHRDRKRDERIHSEIYRQAELSWEHRYSREQVDVLKAESERLREQIQRDVPAEARRVFLRNELETLKQSISELYQQYQTVNTQLGSSDVAESLDHRVKQAIERDIEPPYLRRQRRDRWLSMSIPLILLLIAMPVLLYLSPLNYLLRIVRIATSPDELYAYFTGCALIYVLLTAIDSRRNQHRSVNALRAGYFMWIRIAALMMLWIIVTAPFLWNGLSNTIANGAVFLTQWIPPSWLEVFDIPRLVANGLGTISAVLLALIIRSFAKMRASNGRIELPQTVKT